jgi:hypothetical protein
MLVVVFVDNIASYVAKYRTFDEPVPIGEILVYPVKVKDYYTLVSSIDILRIEKNKIPDVQIIQMSYLAFVLALIVEDDNYRQHFIDICKLCFHIGENDGATIHKFEMGRMLYHQDKGIEVYFINGYNIKFISCDNIITLYIDDVAISGSEFDEIIDVIGFLNFPSYDNEEMSEDFRKLMEEYYTLKNKNINPPTLEEQIIAVMGQTGMSKKDLMEETIYTLQAMVDSIMGKTDYLVQHLYRSHAMTDKKLPEIEHWLIKSKKNKYEEVFSDLEEYKQNFEI